MRLHPLVAFRDCDHCKKWWYDERTGEIHKRHGKDCMRPSPPPCELSCGCPKGHWKNPKTLNWRNMMAYKHYQKCMAVNQFPGDDIVHNNARIIMLSEQSADRVESLKQNARNHSLINLLGVSNAKR